MLAIIVLIVSLIETPTPILHLLLHQVNTEWLESFGGRDFYRADVMVEDSDGKNKARHFIFATDDQLAILQRSKTWFVDGTFHVVKDPIAQLWTINVFLRKEEEMVQTPVLAVFMSQRRELDYQQASGCVVFFGLTTILDVFINSFTDRFEHRFERSNVPCSSICSSHAVLNRMLSVSVIFGGFRDPIRSRDDQSRQPRKITPWCYVPSCVTNNVH